MDGALALHVTNQLSESIVPIRLVIPGVLFLGVWAFSDEMGLRKLLNRAAFICFVFSMLALTVVVLGVDGGDPAQGESALGSMPLNEVEAVFVLWCVATAVLLLKGHRVVDGAIVV